jgi:transposase
MFIKKIVKKNKNSEKEFIYHRLIESYRTPKGPRHRIILNLGKLEIPEDKFKLLANRIEEIIYGQKTIFALDSDIEKLANHFASLIIKNKITQTNKEKELKETKEEFYNVDINSIKTENIRTIGAEYIGYTFFKKLGFEKTLSNLGFTKEELQIATLLIIGRLVRPGSELKTLEWSRTLSGLEELLNMKFKNIALKKLYEVSDKIIKNKCMIEDAIHYSTKELFSLNEKIILYDLTNTYFEGKNYSQKITYGRSKEKRSDCKIITLGLVVDEKGFAKKSEFFEGNISEPKTLSEILDKLNSKGTVIIDAGISTKENLTMLKERGFDYVCVSRGNKIFENTLSEGFVTIKEDEKNRIEVKLKKMESESILFCKSKMKALKEKKMLESFRKRFETGLIMLKETIKKKKGSKNYDKIIERIGRLKERSHGIWQYYTIDVEKDENGKAKEINFAFTGEKEVSRKYDGSYCIRTSRTDLTEKEIWDLYITLNGIEDSFRSLKDELGVRPIFHRKQNRIEGHIFISILAYQILNSIRYKMREKYLFMKWKTIREILSNIVIATVSV